MKRYSENLLVSFSGGETSAFMAQWLNLHWRELGYKKIAFAFANTGLEAEETLYFTNQCAKHFGFDLHWIETKVQPEFGKGVRHNIVTYESASRKGEPYEAIIAKYGIPNPAAPGCTRLLKVRPINDFAKTAFNGEKYDSAIGIRYDEIDRINEKAEKERLVYPLIHLRATKPVINLYWKDMPFRLTIPSYLGNCVACFKKGDTSLFSAIKERPEAMDFWVRMWDVYSPGKEETSYPFRRRRKPSDIIEQAAEWNGQAKDARQNYNLQVDLYDLLDDTESCEVYSNCGDK